MDLPLNRIGRLRKAQGLTTTQLAALLGVHTNTVDRWEKGAGVKDKQKARLAELFGVSISYLMGWPEGNNDGSQNDGSRAAA
jgi:transcriptional regulator with XRE-family HTH domain